MERPKRKDYLQDNLGMHQYVTDLNKFIDYLEGKEKELKEKNNKFRVLLQEVVDNSPHWEKEIENELKLDK